MSAPTLTEFLLARIADDEGRVDGISQAAELDYVIPEDWQFYIDRMASESEAKRRIMERHRDEDYGSFEGVGVVAMCRECRDQRGPCATLRALAAVYADHPDYDEAWRA